nr:SusD/RagB family nutrient-binding outer membrane lipoprotein [Paraflavitalea speifideiaquila]
MKEAIAILTPIRNNAASILFTKSDLVYGGKYAQWLKLANSLRLRLAIRISNVDAAKSKEEGEAALANVGGLLEVPGTISM